MIDPSALKIGLNPPFLMKKFCKNVNKPCNRTSNRECSIFTILKDRSPKEPSPFKIIAVIYTENFHYSINITQDNHYVIFGCFDELQLFFFNDFSVYSCRLSCCRNWNIQCIKAVNLTDQTDYIHFAVFIQNAKPNNEYHYNIAERPLFPILLKENANKIEKYQCPLCFLILSYENSIKAHFKYLHSSYLMKIADKKISIVKIFPNSGQPLIEENKVSIEHTILSSEELGFCPDFVVSDFNDSVHYMDFCSGISIKFDEILNEVDTNEHKEFYNQKLSQETIEKVDELYTKLDIQKTILKPVYIPITLPRDLCISLFDHKEKKHIFNDICKKDKGVVDTYSEITIFFIQPFEVKTGSKPQVKFHNKHKCYLSVITNPPYKYLNEKYLNPPVKNFVYLKKRSTDLINYNLKNYGLLFEYEYDRIDYTPMLSNHLNIRIDQHLVEGAVLSKNNKIMKEWNSLMIQNKTLAAALAKLLNMNGLSMQCVEILEILYTRGLINSEEIMIALGATHKKASD